MEKESGLSTGPEILVAKACEHVWSGIAHDIMEVSVTAKEMVELATDASRLEMNGYTQEQEFFTMMVKNMGYDNAKARVADRCAFDGYEAGGSMAL
jgi:hypothetical protein